jgi:hypothetical protein
MYISLIFKPCDNGSNVVSGRQLDSTIHDDLCVRTVLY